MCSVADEINGTTNEMKSIRDKNHNKSIRQKSPSAKKNSVDLFLLMVERVCMKNPNKQKEFKDG